MSQHKTTYLGNPNLKGSNVSHQWTPEQVHEYIKCANDPIYFAEKYIKIVHVDRGLIPIELYDYQKEVILKFKDNRKLILGQSRQSGKCVHINTIVKVRNKKTGEIIEMTIGELYEQAKNQTGDIEI